MADTKMTAPNGATVTVDKERVDSLLRYGFTELDEKKAPAKKSASSKSKK